MENNDLQRLARIEESDKQAHKRIDKLERDVEEIHNISVSVHEIATEMKAMREDMNNMNDRIGEIESKPAKKWDGLVDKIILTIAGAVIGYFINKLGLGG